MSCSSISPESVVRAARALAGQLVASPWIGEPHWPDRGTLLGLRFKLECLQPSGSAHFRGALFALGRRRGSLAGIRLAEFDPRTRGLAIAALLERVPIHVAESADPRLLCWLARRAIPIASGSGPGGTGFDPLDLAIGDATLGLELGQQAPSDVERVLVPADLAEAVAVGLRASERSIEVLPCERGSSPPIRRAAAMVFGLRLDASASGVLERALATTSAVAVL
ncbi:MAG: hypothetical protein AB7I19_15100 [Planctomycetota bacterium]